MDSRPASKTLVPIETNKIEATGMMLPRGNRTVELLDLGFLDTRPGKRLQKAMENCHRNSGFTHYFNGWISQFVM